MTCCGQVVVQGSVSNYHVCQLFCKCAIVVEENRLHVVVVAWRRLWLPFCSAGTRNHAEVRVDILLGEHAFLPVLLLFHEREWAKHRAAHPKTATRHACDKKAGLRNSEDIFGPERNAKFIVLANQSKPSPKSTI